MAAPPWNHVYTLSDYLSAFYDPDVIAMYVAAINERLNVLCSGSAAAAGSKFTATPATTAIPQYGHLTPPVVGDYAAQGIAGSIQLTDILGTGSTGAPSHAHWQFLQKYVQLLSWFFVKSDVTDYDGSSLITSWAGNQYGQFVSPGFPASGFTAKYSRSITSTSDAGSSGQHAWKSTSPAGVYTHNGTTWVAETDPTVQPDILSTTRIPINGDVIGPWILNDLRDAINQLVWTCGFAGGALPTTFGSDGRGVKEPGGAYIIRDLVCGGYENGGSASIWTWAVCSGFGANATAAQSNYHVTSSGTNTSLSGGTGYCFISASGICGAKSLNRNAVFPSTASSIARDVDWYSYGTTGNFTDEAFATARTIGTFDAEGSDMKFNEWALIDTLSAATGTENQSAGMQPDPNVKTHAPPNFGGSGTTLGWREFTSCFIARWDVTGGFAYTVNT